MATKTIEKQKKYSPFKDVNELEKEIVDFLNRHKTIVSSHGKRISDYFEMCCFNYMVKFYEQYKYNISTENLQKGNYKYKCSTAGNHENFSYFKVSKNGASFEIHHNIAIESFHEKNIYTTPDVSVIKENSIEINNDHYRGNRRLSFCQNKHLITFFEAKQFNPFPELMFNFIGTVNELKHDLMNFVHPQKTDNQIVHIAPSLLISGKSNDHTEKIKTSLEKRYFLNIIFDLFYSGTYIFSKKNVKYLRKIN